MFPANRSIPLGSCAALVAALTTIQIGHLVYFTGGREPLEHFYYQLALFVAPPAFYSFGRWAILPMETFRPLQLLHFLPIPLLFLLPQNIALPILFTFGAGYSLWLGNLVYGLRDRRRQFRFEFLYFAVMSVLAVIVLGLGFAIPYVDHDYFYYFYNNAVALGVAIMLVALVGNPNLIGDLTEAARVKYGALDPARGRRGRQPGQAQSADDRRQGVPERGPEPGLAGRGRRVVEPPAVRAHQYAAGHRVLPICPRVSSERREDFTYFRPQPIHPLDQHGHGLPFAVRVLRRVQGSDRPIARRLPPEPVPDSLMIFLEAGKSLNRQSSKTF